MISPKGNFTIVWMSIITILDLTYVAFWVSLHTHTLHKHTCQVALARGLTQGVACATTLKAMGVLVRVCVCVSA